MTNSAVHAAGVIVSPSAAPYIAAMREAFAKLLLIAAILMMPFGMAAPAAATAHHTAPAASALGHCPDEGAADQRQSAVGECTMACASTLPAIDRGGATLFALAPAPSLRILAQRLSGLHPETATPPPRLA